jgi:molybdate transport system substrate-binding protein
VKRLLLAAAAGVLLAAGCGGSDEKPLTIFAASSLTEVFQRVEPGARFNFAGSDELATQLQEGARADVYAAASPKYPDRLFAAGVTERPRVFATNRLVVVVPDENPAHIRSLRDLGRRGLKLVIGAEGVPIGDYTREVLKQAGEAKVLRNVVSEEHDVKGVVGKVALGEADAGFVYATDAQAAPQDVRAIELPASVQATVRYPVAVVRDTSNRRAAAAFVAALFTERGRRLLRAAGFGLP